MGGRGLEEIAAEPMGRPEDSGAPLLLPPLLLPSLLLLLLLWSLLMGVALRAGRLLLSHCSALPAPPALRALPAPCPVSAANLPAACTASANAVYFHPCSVLPPHPEPFGHPAAWQAAKVGASASSKQWVSQHMQHC